MNNAEELGSRVSIWSMTKYFLMVFVPLTTLVVSLTVVTRGYEIKRETAVFESKESNSLDLLESVIINDYTEIISDLMYLSEVNALEAVLK